MITFALEIHKYVLVLQSVDPITRSAVNNRYKLYTLQDVAGHKSKRKHLSLSIPYPQRYMA